MKILHIVPSYLPAYRYGGPIWSVHNLNKWLVKAGAEVTVLTTDANAGERLDTPLGTPVDIDGVKVYYFPVKFSGWFYSPEMKKAAEKMIPDFDLVHITSVFLGASSIGAHYAKKYGKPYIISPRGSLMTATLAKKWLKKKIYLALVERHNLRGAAAIHFTTEAEKEEYMKAGLPLKNPIVLPNGLDLSEFPEDFPKGEFRKKYGIEAGRRIVLFLSRLSWKKGLDILIPAFAELAGLENAALVLAGGDDEGYKKTTEELISKFGIKDKVIFTGMITGREKIAAYRDADVFVLPSHAENFANVVLEALAMRVPTIVSPEVGLSSNLEEHEAAAVVPRDPKNICAAMLSVFEEPEKWRKISENGHHLVRREYSWTNIAESLLREYDAIVKNTDETR